MKAKKICRYCGNIFKLESAHQVYCLGCKRDAYRKKYREANYKWIKEHPEYAEWQNAYRKVYNALPRVKALKNQWAKQHYEQQKEWQRRNPEKVQAMAHRKYAIKLGYTESFSYEIKKKVKKRDQYTCIICGDGSKTLIVHHKDKTKTNNNIDNLITVCRSCHVKIHNRWQNKL